MKSSIKEGADYGSYSWVNRSRQKRVVIMALYLESMAPMEISLATKKYGKRIILSNLSSVLKELVTGEILTVAGSEINGKQYSLTPKGKEFRNRLSGSPYFIEMTN